MSGDRLQRALIGLHGLCKRSGVLSLPIAESVFLRTYFFYKRHVEDPFADLARAYPAIFQGGHIVDVGANVGYAAALFARVADPGYKVLAFEPDTANFKLLERVAAKYRNIEAIRRAVGDGDGEVEFWTNEVHRGDSRTVTPFFKARLGHNPSTYTVRCTSIDAYLRAHHAAEPVAFIKIDVQGYEEPVLRGLSATLERNPNASVAVEYAPDAIEEMGFSPRALLAFFESRHFNVSLLERGKPLQPVSLAHVDRLIGKRGYCDFIARSNGVADN